MFAFLRWIESDQTRYLVLAAVGAAIAALMKPNNLHIGLPFLYLLYRRFGWRFVQRPSVWIFGVAVLVPVAAWYAHASHLWEVYGNSFFRWYLLVGLYDQDSSFALVAGTLGVRLVKYMAGPTGIFLLLFGFFLRPRESNWVLHWWLAAFLVTVATTPRNHFGHDYYQLPILFVLCAWIGAGAVYLWDLSWSSRLLWRGLAVGLCAGIVGLLLYRISYWTTTYPEHWERIAFGKRVEQYTRPGDIIITIQGLAGPLDQRRRLRDLPRDKWFVHRGPGGRNLGGYPEDLYLSHRHGWSLNEVDGTPQYVELLRQCGARYLVTFFADVLEVRPELKQALDSCCTRIESGEHTAIYRLDGPLVPLTFEGGAPPCSPPPLK
jgi:hypothetical protein